MLTTSQLPVASYSSKAATALIEMGVENIIATTPTIEVYVEVLVRYSNKPSAFIHVLNDPSVYKMDKLWISLPTDGRALYDDQRSNLLHPEAQIQVITLQPQLMELPDFRDYFLRVLRNNYQKFQLFTSYVQQVYNCSDTNCDVDKQYMRQRHRPSMSIEAVIRMTYAFAAVGRKIASDSESEETCIHPTPECTAIIIRELLALDYEFGTEDPPEFVGERLSFYRGCGNVLLASGMTVKAVEFFNSDGELTAHQMMTYTTGHQPTIISSAVRAKNQHKRSICSPYRSFCGQCQNVQWVNEEAIDLQRYFLSIPRHYPMYFVGLFDFHSGPSCQSTATTDISLPMAFIYTVSTIKQRFADMLLLKNFDFGVLFVDSCSSAKRTVETAVMTETQCFSFSQADRNITIVPGSALGYVSALNGNSQEALKGYFSSGDSVAALLTTSLDSVSRHEYSTIPSARNQALALLKFLNRMRWQFVTVALSEEDAESLVTFRHFERLALERGICLAEVLNIRGVRADNLPISTTTNVTIVFSTAREASAYLSLTLRSPRKVIHVMMGDAHDWYLHDTENKKRFQGIVSIQPKRPTKVVKNFRYVTFKDVLHEDFREWASTTTPLTLPESWFWSYVEDRWQCALTQKSKLTYGKMCTGDEQVDLNNLGRMTKAGYLSRGVERFLLIVDSVYKKLCPAQAGLCSDFYEDGRRMIMRQIEKTSVEDDVDIYEFLRIGNGAFSSDQYTYRTIGNWSMNGGLHLHVLFHSFFNEPVESTCKPPMCKCFIDGDLFQQPLDSFLLKAEDIDADRSTGSYVKKQPAFETEKVAYGSVILVKMYLRVVKGNQSLGISLLIGIINLFVTAYFFIFDATDLVCRLRLAMHGFGYSLCFGVMIAKATQLRNAETLGFGSSVHISFWNYWLLLFFIIGVQIALNTRWMTEPFMSTLAVSDSRTEMVCTMGREEFVLANIYVVILLFLTLFINSINRNIKRNYKVTKSSSFMLFYGLPFSDERFLFMQ
ncbi:unnamed protein product [Angiostrongylus costaricensis]|uniref:G_PROTEIN_RECEP_F3_4 domain-containing protein n=1 Tax=Angiostrongylus costaricensis TaxID=334426 RepID=A0A158PMP6_ANGCS|nr:unnamed protein product [Angiostrongylus costaricensis]